MSVYLELGDERIELRCTLRAAMAIEHRNGSFTKAIERIASGDISTCVALVAAGTNRSDLGAAVYARGINELVNPLARFLVLLANGGKEFEPRDDAAPADGKEMTRAEFYERLLMIGTGWLGWTEQNTLDTTMPAILRAYQGRVEMLRAIFGGGEDVTDKAPSQDDIRRAMRAGFRMLAG